MWSLLVWGFVIEGKGGGQSEGQHSQGDQGRVPGESLLWDSLDAVAMETTKQCKRAGLDFC